MCAFATHIAFPPIAATATHTHTQSVTGYYRVGGVVPQQEVSPQHALNYVVQETPFAFSIRPTRSGPNGRREWDESSSSWSPSRFNVNVGADNSMMLTAWIDPMSLDTHNEAAVVAAFAAGTPQWRCDVVTPMGVEWRGVLTHTQLVSMTAVMDALQDSPQEAERHLRSVVMV